MLIKVEELMKLEGFEVKLGCKICNIDNMHYFLDIIVKDNVEYVDLKEMLVGVWNDGIGKGITGARDSIIKKFKDFIHS